MNAPWDDFEGELRSLSPQAISPDLKERIAAEVAKDALKRRDFVFRISYSALAASLLLAITVYALWPAGTTTPPGPGGIVTDGSDPTGQGHSAQELMSGSPRAERQWIRRDITTWLDLPEKDSPERSKQMREQLKKDVTKNPSPVPNK